MKYLILSILFLLPNLAIAQETNIFFKHQMK